ncbi:MAG TPA: dTDP-4-dehydrorhamnose reductase [Anaerolineaceae bacterium]|nr:dTDP-4-dehydrorhamnose reductase [Anaerolineaceae bacterium]
MRILLLGNTGQVGWELNRTLLTLGELVALDYPQINMADPTNIRDTVQELKPQVIVNATAYTNVDKAEEEPELAEAINGVGPGILAEEARKIGAALIHYSTDYVFDGTKGQPYTEEDIPNPINQYGLTKLHGEQAVQAVSGAFIIFRTSWVYSMRRPCFVTKVLEWAKTQQVLRIVDDQISSPTWARMLAEATAQILAQGWLDPCQYIAEKSGIYHLAGRGFCSRYEWAEAILEQDTERQKAKKLIPVKSHEFSTLAERPCFTALEVKKIESGFGIVCQNWKKQLSFLFMDRENINK